MRATITASDPDSREGRASRLHSYLVLAMRYAAPLDAAHRYCLEDMQDVLLGRADREHEETSLDDGRVVLRVDLTDQRMSGQHARLSRSGTTWSISDLDSRNGSFVNGDRVSTRVLEDGDLVELGRTMFVYRATSGPAPSLASQSLSSQPVAMQTLHAPLAADLALIARAAASKVPVMIGGETGTGKEVVARAVHELSGRKGEFIAVNCGAIAKTLLEAELFGYKKGAFSGATEDRPGLVRAADAGTLFLDEVAELPPRTQVALLRVLQEGEVVPVGATSPVRVDLRVVTATHRNLESLVEQESFREDLYARLCGRDLELPPLRERKEDLGILIATFLSGQFPALTFTRSAARALFAYDWPRNIRELRTAIESTLSVLEGSEIGLEVLPSRIRDAYALSDAPAPSNPEQADAERAVREALRDHKGNVTAAAKTLGKSRGHLHRMMTKFRINAADYRDDARSE